MPRTAPFEPMSGSPPCCQAWRTRTCGAAAELPWSVSAPRCRA